MSHEYQGETFSMDCTCEICGARVCDHLDQQHYCDDCKQSHWGDHNHCFLAEVQS